MSNEEVKIGVRIILWYSYIRLRGYLSNRVRVFSNDILIYFSLLNKVMLFKLYLIKLC